MIDRALLWRLCVLVAVPALAFSLPAAMYRYVPDAAGDLLYEVRINRVTGHACILVDCGKLSRRLDGCGVLRRR